MWSLMGLAGKVWILDHGDDDEDDEDDELLERGFVWAGTTTGKRRSTTWPASSEMMIMMMEMGTGVWVPSGWEIYEGCWTTRCLLGDWRKFKGVLMRV